MTTFPTDISDPLAPHYPDVDRTVVAVAKEFAPGTTTGPHRHTRGQFIFAIQGLMVATTEGGTWVVPSDHALWVPPGMTHDVAMHGNVSMRTAYLSRGNQRAWPGNCRVIRVPPLLREALVALSAEAPEYDEAGRAGHLAALILDEIGHAPVTLFALSLPADRRLRILAQRLLADPGLRLDIDGWSDAVGVSRRTLTRLFRMQTGLPFATWRRRLRLLHAVERHASGEPLARVVARLGYDNLAAFLTMARRETGMDFSEFCRSNVSPGAAPSFGGTD